MKTKYFVNLTTGIEFLPDLEGVEIHFLRLQSTACEQGRWNYILNTVDANFLMYLALGAECFVFDMTSRYGGRRPSRAIWQGLEWIKYSLNRAWFDEEIECPYGQHKHFQNIYDHNLYKKTKRRLKYFKNFLHTEAIDVKTFCHRTVKDSDFNFYRKVLEQWKHNHGS
jgi:hypothetical protein